MAQAQHGKLLSGSHSRWESTGLKHYNTGDILYNLTEVELSPESSLAGRLRILGPEELPEDSPWLPTSGTATSTPSTPPMSQEEDQVAEDFSFLAGLSAKDAIRVIADITTLHGAQSAELWESDTSEGGKNRPTVIAAIQAKIQEIQETEATGQNQG